MTDVALVAVGGTIGAVVRWAAGRRGGEDFPWPTLVVNVAGSLLLGVVAHAGPAWALTLLGSGVAGALTTYSAFALETLRIPWRAAVWYVVVSLTLGSAGFALGWWIGGLA